MKTSSVIIIGVSVAAIAGFIIWIIKNPNSAVAQKISQSLPPTPLPVNATNIGTPTGQLNQVYNNLTSGNIQSSGRGVYSLGSYEVVTSGRSGESLTPYNTAVISSIAASGQVKSPQTVASEAHLALLRLTNGVNL